ncbi:MAG: hypothetical protein AAFZ15_30540 [Bacteroidota bacterium]
MSSMLDDFLAKNWFDLLQSGFIVAGFVLSYLAIRGETQAKKVEHLLNITQSHREIWEKTYTNPKLLRIRKSDIDLDKEPITEQERRMAKEIIMHIYVVNRAIKNRQLDKGEMEKDIADFLSHQIPNRVWHEVKGYYDKRFVNHIEGLLSKNRAGK